MNGLATRSFGGVAALVVGVIVALRYGVWAFELMNTPEGMAAQALGFSPVPYLLVAAAGAGVAALGAWVLWGTDRDTRR